MNFPQLFFLSLWGGPPPLFLLFFCFSLAWLVKWLWNMTVSGIFKNVLRKTLFYFMARYPKCISFRLCHDLFMHLGKTACTALGIFHVHQWEHEPHWKEQGLVCELPWASMTPVGFIEAHTGELPRAQWFYASQVVYSVHRDVFLKNHFTCISLLNLSSFGSIFVPKKLD